MLAKLAPVLTTAVLVFTQAPPEPDFSGDWKLVSSTPAGADAAIAMTVVQPIKRQDVYGKPMKPFFSELLVTRYFSGSPRAEIHRIGAIGGQVGGVIPGGRRAGTESRHSVAWEARTLVMKSSRYDGAEWDSRREDWSFDEQGRLRVVITTQSSHRPEARSVTLIYQRV